MRLVALVLALAPALACAENSLTNAPPANSQLNWGGMNVGLSGQFAFGGASVNDAAMANLQGGGHDPSRNGFTMQNVELSLSGAVDPYFDAQANFVWLIDAAGETVTELEEAFIATRALPHGLQVKAGQYYTEFGRHNPQHPHVWAFVDQPVVLSRVFGADGLRSTGARVGWLMPLPWFGELIVGAQNAAGETLQSFLWTQDPADSIGGYALNARGGARNAGDLLFSARWLNGFDVGDATAINLGVSALRGPNATDVDTATEVYGIDAYIKWKAARNDRGFPFVAWQTEVLQRDYEIPGGVLTDNGGYTQMLWGYRRGWVAGLRGEYAYGRDNGIGDPLRDRRVRVSPNITYYPTEYSKIRAQYNYDRASHLAEGHAHAVWLQYDFSLGAHAAHLF